MTEMWASIPGWEGCYEASTEGRVRSLTRIIISKTGIPRVLNGNIKKANRQGRYMWMTLNRDGRFYSRSVHSLVLEAFVGPRSKPEMDCLHRNGDGTDNRPINLRWGSRSENIRDTVSHGTHPETRKTHCPRGHAYEEANIYWRYENGRPWRNCRTCILERQRQKRLEGAR